MEVKNLAELKKLIALLRKSGVETFKTDKFEFTLGAKPTHKSVSKKSTKIQDDGTELKQEPQYTAEDMLFWSSAGLPAEGVQ